MSYVATLLCANAAVGLRGLLAASPRAMRSATRLARQNPKCAIFVCLLLAALCCLAFAPLHEWLALGVAWINAHGKLACIAFIGAYIVSTVSLVPGSILTLAAGFIFGLPAGIVLVSAGSTLGAAAGFLVSRFLARDWVAAKVTKWPRFKALDSAVGQNGFLVVFLTRLSPLFPFNLLNYGLGLTKVRFRDFFLATWIGMLPTIPIYVYVGTLAKNVDSLTGGLNGSAAGRIMLAAGLLVSVAITVFITRKAHRTLTAHLQMQAEPD